MWNEFLFSIWFFLPGGVANVTPILVTKLPVLNRWNTPLDLGLSYRKQQIFGSNKTWRGFVCGVVVSELVFLVERSLASHLGSFSTYLLQMHFMQLPILFGFLIGAGVIFGDAIESFFKRQHSIAPGSSWFPYDQIDYIVGGCVAAAVVIILPFSLYVWIFITWFLMHLAFSYLGFLLHFKAKPI